MAKVPELDANVTTNTPLRSPLSVKTPEIPNPIEGQFGGNVAKAIEGAGNQIEKLGINVAGHIQRMNYWDAEEKGYQALEGFRTAHSDLLNSSDISDIQVGDKTISIPKGYMNRQMEQSSKNDLPEYQKQVTALRDKVLSGINHPQIREMISRKMDQEIGSGYKNLVKYVGSQDRLTYVKSIASDTYNLQQSAAGVTDPEQLKLITDQIADNNKKIDTRMGFPESMSQENLSKALAPAVLNSAKAIINSGGTVDDANKLIDSQSKSIGDESISKMKDDVDRYFTSQTALKARMQESQTISDRFSVFDGLLSNKIDYKNADGLISGLSKVDPKLGEAVQAVVDNRGKYEPTTQVGIDYQNFVDNVLVNAKTKREASDFIVKQLAANGGKDIAEEKLKVLVNAAAKRADTLETAAGYGDGKFDPHQQAVDNFTSGIIKWGSKLSPSESSDAMHDFLSQVDKGVEPSEAFKGAIRAHYLKVNPAIAQAPEKGAIYIDSQGRKATLRPDGTYDPISSLKFNQLSKKGKE